MAEWNDTKNMSLTFGVKADENMKDFVDRMYRENVDREEAFKRRIKQLFDEYIEVGGEKKDEAYQQILSVFGCGYQNGWADFKSLYDNVKGKENEE